MTIPFWFSLMLFFLLAALSLALLLLLRITSREKSADVQAKLDALQTSNVRLEREFREESARARLDLSNTVATQISKQTTVLGERLEEFGRRLTALASSNDSRLEAIRGTVEQKLELLRTDSASKLEQMRATVDEKLHATLEQRLGQTFALVSERLEQVHKGLGEMQTLAAGVGDLKKVLTNVKTRGTWGEVQLGNLLEQILTAAQYEPNVATRPQSRDRVEFAIRLPGHGEDVRQVWLPIDAKFPLEDFQRLQDAQERGDLVAIEVQGRALETRIRVEARLIREKYVQPPHTTDFAILYLPVESLYAEVLRRAGLADTLQRDFHITLAGPTTLAAMLNSLQMGFRTLAIEKRSSEVWALLGAVKHEFGKFGDVLAKTRKKLDEASNVIGDAETRTRQINRKLSTVATLAEAEATELLGPPESIPDLEEGGPTAPLFPPN